MEQQTGTINRRLRDDPVARGVVITLVVAFVVVVGLFVFWFKVLPSADGFNDPAVLAKNVQQQYAGSTPAVDSVTCQHDSDQEFTCSAHHPNGSSTTMHIQVAEDGTTWNLVSS